MRGIVVQHYQVKRGDFSLNSIDLTIGEGEIFAVLGRTGSGKTMLLESIAGFYQDGEGMILIDGIPVNRIPAEERQIGFVDQAYGLFPHMSVYQNIAYGLVMRKRSKLEIKERVAKIAADFSIAHTLAQYPETLSGGEKQRVAMARALIMKPRLLLLDEPFSALDPATKDVLYKQIQDVREHYGCPILFVTHNFEEASLLADRIGIMEEGSLRAIRTPQTLFEPYDRESIHQFLGIKGE